MAIHFGQKYTVIRLRISEKRQSSNFVQNHSSMLARIIFSFLLFSHNAGARQAFIYVSDVGDFQDGPSQVLKYTAAGEFVQVFTNENLGWPQDILFLDADSTVLISN